MISRSRIFISIGIGFLSLGGTPASELILTEIQQAQLDRLRSEIEIGLEQARAGDTVDGETVFANLRTRIDSYREPK